MTVVLATGVCWHSGLTGLTARAGLSSAAPAPTDTSTHPPHGTTHLAHGTIKYTNILMEYKISGLHRSFAPFYCPSDTHQIVIFNAGFDVIKTPPSSLLRK